MHPQRTRSLGSYSGILLSVTGILLILVLAGCSSLDSPATYSSTPTISANNSTTPTTGATATSTDATTATATHGGTTATPTLQASASPVPFRVLSITAAANNSNFSGTCGTSKTITITGIIYAPAHNTGGMVTYEWTRSDNSTGAHHTITFATDATALTVTYTWALGADLGNGTTHYWVALKTLTPQLISSSHASFTFKCKRQVTALHATALPTTGCTTVGGVFSFSATITVSPGPGSVTISYIWKRSDGASSGSTLTVPVPQDTLTVTVPDSWTLTGTTATPLATGTHWEEVVVSSPNGLTSNEAKFTITTC